MILRSAIGVPIDYANFRAGNRAGALIGLAVNVSVSNWPSGCDWELDQPSAVRVPPHVVQISWATASLLAKVSGVRPPAMPDCVPLVVRLELGQLPFQITAIPEQHLVETFAPHRPDQALDKWVRQRRMRYSLDFVDLENAQVLPSTDAPQTAIHDRCSDGAVSPAHE
jgi:hypothetical protein